MSWRVSAIEVEGMLDRGCVSWKGSCRSGVGAKPGGLPRLRAINSLGSTHWISAVLDLESLFINIGYEIYFEIDTTNMEGTAI